jgi:hypothetical protein
MAALTANTTIVQILKDTPTEVVARLFLHQNPAGDESSVLKINCETLSYRTFVLVHNQARVAGLQAGDKVIGATSGAVGYVVEQPAANQVLVTNVTGAFSAAEVVNGTRSTPNATFTTSSAVVTPARLLSIRSASWMLTSNNQQVEAKAGLEFANSTVFSTALMLSEVGDFGEAASGWAKTKIFPLPVNPNGNLYVSTYGIPANGGYHIFVELRKEQGFAPVPQY